MEHDASHVREEEGGRGVFEGDALLRTTSATAAQDPPTDSGHFGFLFPFNSYISAVDYFIVEYPEKAAEFYIPLVYMYVTFPMMIVNVFFGVKHMSVTTRIRFGFVCFLLALAAFPIVEQAAKTGSISKDTAYAINLASVVLVGLGGGVQQSSFYGFTGMLSAKHTQGLMAGESIAGVIVSLNRIATKASFADSAEGIKKSTFIFFYNSIAFIFCCAVMFEFMRRTRYVQYHTQRKTLAQYALESHVRLSQDDARVPLTLESEPSPRTSPPSSPSQKRSGAAHKPFVVPHAVPELVPPESSHKRIAKKTWRMMLGVAIIYFVTLSLFPGVVANVPSKNVGTWMPVIMIAVFNLWDLIGKIVPAWPWDLSKLSLFSDKKLVFWACGRVVFFPLLIMCVSPEKSPVLAGEAWGIVLTSAFAFTNAFFSTIQMQRGPELVDEGDREAAGNFMALALLAGLTAGSTFALAFMS